MHQPVTVQTRSLSYGAFSIICNKDLEGTTKVHISQILLITYGAVLFLTKNTVIPTSYKFEKHLYIPPSACMVIASEIPEALQYYHLQ